MDNVFFGKRVDRLKSVVLLERTCNIWFWSDRARRNGRWGRDPRRWSYFIFGFIVKLDNPFICHTATLTRKLWALRSEWRSTGITNQIVSLSVNVSLSRLQWGQFDWTVLMFLNVIFIYRCWPGRIIDFHGSLKLRSRFRCGSRRMNSLLSTLAFPKSLYFDSRDLKILTPMTARNSWSS